jgi:hypothetical protein
MRGAVPGFAENDVELSHVRFGPEADKMPARRESGKPSLRPASTEHQQLWPFGVFPGVCESRRLCEEVEATE